MLTHFSISQQGKRHIEKGVPCQDFSASKRIYFERFEREIVVAAVSDGVGSCEYSQFGSKTAVLSFLHCVEYNIHNRLPDLADERILNLIKYSFNYALSQVEKEAEKRELPFLEFDSTLTGIVYDGHTLWYGHIGDDGVVVLYSDGDYEMITKRHKGEEAHSLFPLREVDLWQFGKSSKEVASCVLMTDGVLDHCVDVESMGNRVYFPFLEPALTETAFTDEDAERQRLDWDEYLSGRGDYAESFRDKVTDDISFVLIQNPDLLKDMPPVQFDFEKWDEDTARRKKELDDALYADYRAYKAGTYQSSIKRAAGYYSKRRSSVIPESQPNREEYPNGKFCERDEFPQVQAETQNDVHVDETDDFVDDICAEVAEAFMDVFKTAHSVGKFVRKQLTPKKRKKTSSQKQSAESKGTESEGAFTTNATSDVKLSVQHQGVSANIEEKMDNTPKDE